MLAARGSLSEFHVTSVIYFKLREVEASSILFRTAINSLRHRKSAGSSIFVDDFFFPR
jgi:hypothetical protein